MNPYVVAYLRGGKSLGDLEMEHGVVARGKGNKVSLSYHQIEARRDDPLASQCRGLILRRDTWDVVAWPFDRFFDADEEQAAVIDWSTARILEKMDGTMIIVYYDKVSWHAATRKDPDASTITPSGLTYRQMTESAVFNMTSGTFQAFMDNYGCGKRFTYVFELTAPDNQIVCQYEDRRLWFLGARDMTTMQEDDLREDRGSPCKFVRPRQLEGPDTLRLDWIKELVETRSVREHEGVVAVDSNYNRIKIKSTEYCRRNHMLDADKTYAWQWRMHAPWTSLIEAILTNKSDHIGRVSSERVRSQIEYARAALKSLCDEAEIVFRVIEPIDDMKQFASLANRYKWPEALFAIKRGTAKSAWEHATKMRPKKLVRMCKLKGEMDLSKFPKEGEAWVSPSR